MLFQRGRSMLIILLRTVILYIFIIIGIRLLGKRQVGELEPTELVLALLIADLASVPMQENGIPLLAGLIPIVTLLCLAMIMSILMMHSIKFRAFLCGRPSIVIEHGILKEGELLRNRFTLDELMEELRGKGFTDISSIQYAVLETNGTLSVIPKASEQPVTASQLGLSPSDPGLPAILISDGRLLSHNLDLRGYDRKWLSKQLHSYGVSQPEEVFLLTVDENGKTYFVAKENAR